MKIYLTFILLLGFFVAGISQPDCDILTPGISSTPSTIMVGQTSDLVFTVYNDAQGGDCCYDIESVLVYVFLPENGGLTFQSIISPAGGTGPFFDWEFDAMANTVIGINHTAICDAEGELDVTVRIIGSSLPFYPQNRTVGITILNNPDGPPFLSNNEGNDNGLTTLTITAPLPVKLKSFDVRAVDCQKVEIVWETASEINNKNFEVQRSQDGRTFETIAILKGNNSPYGGKYQLFDGNIVKNGTYYYRLRQVDFDGTETVFDPLLIKTKDCSGLSSIDLYPNPAMDKITVASTGENDFEKLVITDILGKVIRTIEYPEGKRKVEIDISMLTSGVYHMRTDGETTSNTIKFVKL